MRRYQLFALSIVLAAMATNRTPALATVLVQDQFLSGTNNAAGQYDPNTNLLGQNPTISGMTGGWSLPIGTASNFKSQADGLTYPGVSSSGGRVGLLGASSTNLMRRNFSSSTQVTSTMYFSALFRADETLDVGLSHFGFVETSDAASMHYLECKTMPATSSFSSVRHPNGT